MLLCLFLIVFNDQNEVNLVWQLCILFYKGIFSIHSDTSILQKKLTLSLGGYFQKKVQL